MVRAVKRLLRRYGGELVLCHQGTESRFRGFLSPVRSGSWQNTQWELTALGELPRGQYVLIAPVGLVIQAGDTVSRGGKTYSLRRTEEVYYCENPVYIWGVCTEKGEEDPWAAK